METTKNMQSQAGRTSWMKTAAGIVGICLAVLGLGAMISLFVDYRSSETTDDAQIEQYLSPVNIRVPGYIKRICFTEHQHVRKGDTLLVLEDDELGIFRYRYTWYSIGIFLMLMLVNSSTLFVTTYLVRAIWRVPRSPVGPFRVVCWGWPLRWFACCGACISIRYFATWLFLMVAVRNVVAPAIGTSVYANWLQEKQQHYITRFVQDVRPDNPQSSIPFAQASLLGQMQGKDGLEASRLASTMLKGKVSLQATLVAMKDITGSTIWICLGGMAFALLIPYHKHERT